MIKAVIFDLDGLLIDSEIVSYKIYKEILNQFGHSFSIEEYAQNFSGKTEVKNVTNLIDTYNLPWTVEVGLDNVLKVEDKFINEGIDLKTGVKKLLTYLKDNNLKIAIASSSTRGRALTILRQHNIVEYFDEFVFGNEIEKGKPNPDIFLKACDKISVNPEECLVLEDSESGILAAYDGKIDVLCIPDMKYPEADFASKATKIISSLKDVIEYLK